MSRVSIHAMGVDVGRRRQRLAVQVLADGDDSAQPVINVGDGIGVVAHDAIKAVGAVTVQDGIKDVEVAADSQGDG